ncbi:Tetratricopeptide repeat protein 1-like protein 2 [Coniochaeta hoffmannii]|uniref:Tetratricopeptide repeat protein 1-like protein 2 n=1 Tax=Coniochaeta hoffmannii TaxID=91930 RepID=A0AA38VG24_9PEZI|nr:Tetratricopeptide repeat protein 1-like protein 2 [Coniochaeta hoffmannii]
MSGLSPNGKPPGMKDEDAAEGAAEPAQEKLAPEEEASLLDESNTLKAEANSLFSAGKHNAAINKYDEALAVLPTYLDFELAVLRSNISACHLKLDEWKDAITHATAALDGLDRLERANAEAEKESAEARDKEEDVEEVIVSAGAAKSAPAPPRDEDAAEEATRKRKEDIARIRAKALMRRARARSELAGWSNLEGALADYKALSVMTNLSPADRKIVQAQLRLLPPRVKAAQEKETAEMWAKLKDLGNGILKPFGLSTDNFKMAKDEKTGGYSMNFGGGSPEKK